MTLVTAIPHTVCVVFMVSMDFPSLTSEAEGQNVSRRRIARAEKGLYCDMVRRVWFALVLTWFCNGQPSARDAQDVRELTSGASIERALASGASDTFRLALTTRDFVPVPIVQRGFAVKATLSRPDGGEAVAV